MEGEETESEEESLSESESESECSEHREMLTPKSPSRKMYSDSEEEIEKVRGKDKKKMPQKSKVATAKSSPHSERLVEEEQYKQKKGKRSVDMKEQSELRAKASRGKPHSQVKEMENVEETDSGKKAKRPAPLTPEQASNESQTDSENEDSDSGNDSSEGGKDSKGEFSDEEHFTAPSDLEEEEEHSVFIRKEKEKKVSFQQGRKSKKKGFSTAAVMPSTYNSPDKTIAQKIRGKRVSEAASLQSDGSWDQEEHDIQQKRSSKKKRREISLSLTAIGSSSPSTSQEEKKKQPVSKKQGHRKKHVRKMKEKRERMKRGKGKTAHSSGTDDSSPECDMTKYQYEGEMKELVNIFERFFGQLCCAVFDPKDIAAKLQKKGLISKSMMRDMMLSPESQQAKIIALIDCLDGMIKSRPENLFVIIKVMLENEALQETAREIQREAGTLNILCAITML